MSENGVARLSEGLPVHDTPVTWQARAHQARVAIKRGDIDKASAEISFLRSNCPAELSAKVVYPLEEQFAELEAAQSWRIVPKTAITAAIAAVAAAVIGVGGTVTAAAINRSSPPIGCLQAIKNVDEALKLGITDPVILGNLNPAEVDARCGDEQAIKTGLGK